MTEEREPTQRPFDAMFDAALDMATDFPNRKTGNEWSEWYQAGFRLDIDDGPEKAIKLSAVAQSFGHTALQDRLEDPGKYAKANRDGTRFLHRASIDFSTGETEYTDYTGTYAQLKEVNRLENDRDFLVTPAALFDKILIAPLYENELGHVLGRYYWAKDKFSRVGRRSAPYEEVVDRFIPLLAVRDDGSQQRLVAGMASVFEQSDRGENHITQLNEKLVEYMVGQPPHDKVDDKYRHARGFSLMQTMDEAGLLRTRPLASMAMMVIPGMPRVLLDMKRSGIDVFEGRANAERMSYAQNYVYTLLNSLQKTPGRHHESVKLIRENLFKEKHRKTLSWQDMLKFANGITTGANTNVAQSDKRELLPATDTAENFSYLGEALFRILEATSNTPEQTNTNREYAELLETILQPLYEHFGRSPTYMSVADLCARYPGLSGDQLQGMLNAADRGGYSLASEQYAEIRRNYGKRVGWRKWERGSGTIS